MKNLLTIILLYSLTSCYKPQEIKPLPDHIVRIEVYGFAYLTDLRKNGQLIKDTVMLANSVPVSKFDTISVYLNTIKDNFYFIVYDRNITVNWCQIGTLVRPGLYKYSYIVRKD